MKALYRRYRPKTLSEVVGQEQITSVLANSIKNGKLSHAYLFIGPRGTGKTSVARILAHEINDFKYELEDDYLDIIEIDAASNTGVDNIRDLRERAIIAPSKGKYKVYIIDEVHMLSKSAFNALLKTLEEPPEHVIFIMATTDAHKVPITITSRSQVFTFKLADPSTMFEHLKSICKKEKIAIDDEALKIVVKRGGGSFRDSLSLLDQVSTLSDKTITAELLTKALGLPQDEAIANILQAYRDNNTETIRQELNTLADSGIKPELIAAELIDAILAQPDAIYLPLLDKLTEVSRSAYPAVKLLLALCQNAQTIAVPRPNIVLASTTKTTTVVKTTTPQPKPTPEPEQPAAAEEPKPAPVQAADGSSADEIWRQALENIRAKSAHDATNLEKVSCNLSGSTLYLHTTNSFIKKRIEANRKLISAALPSSYTIEISDKAFVKDPDIANIMEIMGGGEEIQIDE